MRKSIHIVIVVMLVISILPNILSFKEVNVSAATQYIDGDWIVNTTESYTDEIIILNGNLTIESGGHLTLSHVTLALNCTTEDGQFDIEVLNGGTLIISDIDGNPATVNDFSNITDSPFDVDDGTDTDYEYAIRVNEGASFSLTNSLVRECGYDGNDNTGVQILADNVAIENCTFENNRYSVHIANAENFKIANNHIRNSDMGILTDFLSKEGEIFDNEIHDSTSGIYFQGINLSIHNNHVYNCQDGIYSKIGFVNSQIYENEVHDNTQTGMYLYQFWSYSSGNNQIFGNIVYNNPKGLWFMGETTQIYNNFIHNNTDVGMHLTYVINSEVFGNTIINNGENVPEDWRHNLKLDSCDNVTIHHNDIKYLQPFCYHSVLIIWSSNITFHNNTVVENGNFRMFSTVRVDMDSSDTNIRIMDNVISDNLAGGMIVYGQGLEYNSVEISGNDLINNAGTGMSLVSLRDYKVTDNIINSASGDGVFADDLKDGEFSNNIVNGPSYDFRVRDTNGNDDDTFFVVTNCTPGPFSTYLTQGYPDISFEYYLHIYVYDQFGPAPNITLTVEDTFSTKVFVGETGADGYIRYLKLTTMTEVRSPGGNYTTFYDPYNISASDSGYTAYGEIEPVMDQSQTVNVFFDFDLLPEDPTNLNAESERTDVNVSWTASHSPDLSHYIIYRNDTLGGWMQVHDTSGDTDPHQTFWIDPNAASDWTTYWYKVLAEDAGAQQSGFSNIARCGDWAIGDTRLLIDLSVQLNGSFIVLDTGVVTLRNVHMVFNSSYTSQFGVHVHPLGELHVLDGDDDPLTTFDQSNITALNWVNGFYFDVEGDIFELRNSKISYCGFNIIWLIADWDIHSKAPQIVSQGGSTKSGIYIAPTALDVTIEYNEFSWNFVSILIDGATNCNINNNTFSNNVFGVYLYSAYDNQIIDNVFSFNYAYSIYLFNSQGNTISRNDISIDPDAESNNNLAAGIVIFERGSNFNTINDNNVIDGDYGIALYEAGVDNILSNNFLKDHERGDAAGIYIYNTTFAYLFNNDFNNSMYGCMIYYSDSITASGGSAIGGFFAYYVENSGNVTINDIFCQYLAWGVVGLFFNDLMISNITVINGMQGGLGFMGGTGVYAENVIIEDAWIAIYCVFDMDSVRIKNVIATKNIEQAFYGEGASNIFIENGTFNATVLEFNLTVAQVTVTNTTYNQSRIILDQASSIAIFWYVHVKVLDWTGTPVSGAQVQIRKVFGTIVYNGFSDINGYARWVLLHERTQYNITNETSNPHFINVFYGSHSGTEELALNQTSVITVNLGNLAPTASNVIISPTLPTTISDLTLSYQFTDPENDPEGSSLILWYINGIHNTSYNNMMTIASLYTQKGQIWFCEVIPHDGAVYGVPMTSTPVSIQNTPPVVTNVAIIEGAPTSSDNLHVSYDYSDIDLDSEGLSLHRWYVDRGPGFVYSGVDAIELDSSHTLKGDLWKCIVTPSDGEDLGIPMDSNIVTIGNTVPEIVDASVTPSGFPASNETLVATYTYFDLDSDLESGSDIDWYKDGVLQSGLSGIFQVDPTKTRAGEKWYYFITPSDGVDFGIAFQSDSVEIANTPPSVSNIQITPQTPSTDDDLIAGYDYYDEDGDLESEDTIIKWYRMRPGDIVFTYTGYQGTTLSSTFTTKDEVWKCEVIPHDGLNYGPSLLSTVEVTIGNSPPSASDVHITPTSPTTKDDLFANYDYFDLDSDLESESEISWFRNSVQETGLNNQLTVSSDETEKGEVWYFTVRPKDGVNFGVEMQSPSVTIHNSAPQALNPRILNSGDTQFPKGEDDLLASYSYIDEDGDTEVAQEIRWYKNGVLQEYLNNELVVNFNATEKGDLWYFTIRVADGDLLSELNNSYFVEIENSKPIVSSVSPAVSTVEINETESFDFFVDVADPDGDFLLFKWRLGKSSVGDTEFYELETDYESAGTYLLNLSVQDIGENSIPIYFEWEVVVNNVNLLPEIEVKEPTGTNPKMKEGTSLKFIIDESDPDSEDTLTITWYLDDGVAQNGGSSYTYVADDLASGWHDVKAEVSDGENTTEYIWDLKVEDVAKEELFGMSYDALGLIMALISGLVAILLFMFGLYRVRKKKGALKTYMAEIDEISTSQDENPIEYENRINEVEDKINSDFRNGHIEDLHYLMLQEIITTRRGHVRKAAITQKFDKLPEGITSELDEMLSDGKITKAEYESFVATISMTKSLTGDQKKELSKMIEEWEAEDKDGEQGEASDEKPKKDVEGEDSKSEEVELKKEESDDEIDGIIESLDEKKE